MTKPPYDLLDFIGVFFFLANFAKDFGYCTNFV